jgi:hypothetical protein
MPQARRIRRHLLERLKIWYTYAREHFHDGLIEKDGNSDPIWGSEMMRARQKNPTEGGRAR